jgi:hypothetical protein
VRVGHQTSLHEENNPGLPDTRVGADELTT